MDYRTALRKCREQSGFSQKDLAKHLKIDSSQLSRIEKCSNQLDVDRFFQACEFLGVSAEKLFTLAASLPEEADFNYQEVRLGTHLFPSLLVEDMAMMRPSGRGIPPGARVFYDDKATPKNHDMVVVRAGDRCYVRQYIDDMGKFKLKPLNEQDYETRDASAFELVGVVKDVSLEKVLKAGL